jgi:hypothetical protein
LGNLSESCGWWDHGRGLSGEWTCEGRTKAAGQVVSDGSRTRYQRGRECWFSETSGRNRVNLGGTAGWKSCPNDIGIGLFLLPCNKKLNGQKSRRCAATDFYGWNPLRCFVAQIRFYLLKRSFEHEPFNKTMAPMVLVRFSHIQQHNIIRPYGL